MDSIATSNQRETYKLVEKLSSGAFKSEVDLLNTLVREIVDNDTFNINGGRVWELHPEDNKYMLVYQYGKLDNIPDGYLFDTADYPQIFSKLLKDRTTLSYETDPILIDKGITLYSVTGVGEIFRTKNGKLYKYLLGFNAPEIQQSFYENLNVISSVATISLRNMSSIAEKERISRDIISASEIQRNLFPEHKHRFHDYDIFGICVPDEAVGGDYFDYFRESDVEHEHLGIVISDAASKGLPAAIQALFVSGAIRMARRFNPKISHLMSGLNNLIYETFPFERFVTLCYIELTTSSNRLVLYANAGHCPPVHYRAESDEIRLLDSTGGLLGLMENQKFRVENIRMRPGDVLVMYTDGIIECRDRNGQLFGEDRLYDLIRKHHKDSPKNIAAYIFDEVQRWSVGSSYTDDKTLVVIKRDSETQ